MDAEEERGGPGRALLGPTLWCLVAAGLFGAATPASKPLLGSLSVFHLSGLLYLGAALAVAPWALRTRPEKKALGTKSALRLAGAVFFGGVLGPLLLLMGLSRAPAGSVALWLNLETVATALLARAFFKEQLGRNTWLAVFLILAASALLSPSAGVHVEAMVLLALACVAWGLDNNLTAVIDQFTPAQTTFLKGLVAGSLNLLLGSLLAPSEFSVELVLAALGIGALGYGASILLYIAGAQQLGATRSQLVFSTAPAWGLALAWIALGERVEPLQVLAALLMALAIWLWHREKHSHAHRHAPVHHRHWHRHDDGHHDHAHEKGLSLSDTWHSHVHDHAALEHEHPHRPDLHHRHDHEG